MATSELTRSEERDTDSRLDWGWDWADPAAPWLTDGETITTLTVTAEGCTATDDGINGSLTVAWVSGGVPNTEAVVTFHIITSEGRENEAVIRFVNT